MKMTVRNTILLYLTGTLLIAVGAARADLVALWQYDTDLDPQPDASVNGNDAAYAGNASWLSDLDRGGVMVFDGNEDFLEASDSASLSITGDITITAWVKVTDFNGFRGIVGKTSVNVAAPYDFYLASGTGLPSLLRGNGTLFDSVDGTNPPMLNVWQHVAVTMSGTTVTHYLNGQVNGSGTLSTTIVDQNESLRIGSRDDLATDMLGRMDDVGVYDHAMAAQEVAARMNGDYSNRVHNLTQATDYFMIQAAIDAAVNGDVIEADPGSYFEAIDFLGKSIAVRSASGNPSDTIIDGSGNFHVVQCVSGETSTTVLQGFTVTGGSATGAFPNDIGGGMYNDDGSPTVIGCIFVGNSAAIAGGGMINFNSSNPTITHCTFTGNSAGQGGGMQNVGGSSPTVAHCTFNGNSATAGAGMTNGAGGSSTITYCTFSGNSAVSVGGGMFNASTSYSTVVGCTFSGNSADTTGGGIYSFNGSGTITQCSFSQNTAILDGGGIFNTGTNNASVNNSIFWGNSDNGGAMDESAQIHVDTGTQTPTVTYSNVMGGWTGIGTGNINADPLFVDVNGADNIVGTVDDNLRLQAGSPAIDAGHSALVAIATIDLDSNQRIVDDPATIDTGIGFPEVVDMGAYEFGSSPDPCENAIPGDINCDGTVNLLDQALLALHWLETI
jgi:predicted outer membrane repeat protein